MIKIQRHIFPKMNTTFLRIELNHIQWTVQVFTKGVSIIWDYPEIKAGVNINGQKA